MKPTRYHVMEGATRYNPNSKNSIRGVVESKGEKADGKLREEQIERRRKGERERERGEW